MAKNPKKCPMNRHSQNRMAILRNGDNRLKFEACAPIFDAGFRVLLSVDPTSSILELTEQVDMIITELKALKPFTFHIMLKPGVIILFVEPGTVLSWNQPKARKTQTQFVNFQDPKQLVNGTIIITPGRPKLQILWPIIWTKEAHA